MAMWPSILSERVSPTGALLGHTHTTEIRLTSITKWITSGVSSFIYLVVPAKLCQTSLQHDSCPMCRRQFLQQQRSSQTAEELARAEVSAQAVLSHVREVGQYMRTRGEILRVSAPGGILEARLHSLFTRNGSVEDDRDEAPLNSGMYS